MTTYTEKINAIIKYFEENEEIFNECIEELDSYNGYLCDDRYYYMEEMKDLYCDYDPIDLLNRAFFGHDSETWTTSKDGTSHYGEFNPNRDYFKFNAYGNLVSADYKDYSSFLDSFVIEEMKENRSDIYSIEDDETLTALFDELEEDEEE